MTTNNGRLHACVWVDSKLVCGIAANVSHLGGVVDRMLKSKKIKRPELALEGAIKYHQVGEKKKKKTDGSQEEDVTDKFRRYPVSVGSECVTVWYVSTCRACMKQSTNNAVMLHTL